MYRTFVRTAALAWAAPNSGVGLLAGVAVLAFGGRVRIERGAVEFWGGGLGEVAQSLPARIRFSAMTLGHVILGVSDLELAAARNHEHVHVRQYERWGPFFLPAYLASSVWQVVCGRRAYRDNVFEREAYALEDRHVSRAAESRQASAGRHGDDFTPVVRRRET